MDVLTRIDDAVAERCHCGCGRPLDPTGPSAWWAGEACQRRGLRSLAGSDPCAWAGQVTPEQAAEVLRVVADVTANVAADWMRHLVPALRRAGEAMAEFRARAAGAVKAEPPQDPMKRALWLRRNRNTGPRVEGRAPRRIEPRRVR